MVDAKLTMAQQVAQAISKFQRERTGHAPVSVTVVLSEGMLVVTMNGVLSPAEKMMAQTPEGAAQVREFHRELFQNSVADLRAEIQRITGVDVHECNAELETKTGAVIHVFTSGTMVQVFQLGGNLSEEAWNGTVVKPAPILGRG